MERKKNCIARANCKIRRLMLIIYLIIDFIKEAQILSFVYEHFFFGITIYDNVYVLKILVMPVF